MSNNDHSLKMRDKRHKVEDREWFDEDFRERIAAKSDHKCVCCGKEKYFGYGATIDHYVPLIRGGTNEEDNLVMMCEKCNKEKDRLIIPPYVGAKYLKPEHQKSLDDYFDAFLKKYRYLNNDNLLSCDVYAASFIDPVLASYLSKAPKKKAIKMLNRQKTYFIKKCYPQDEERLTDYLARYLKKYDRLGSKELARENIKFWEKFGAIYYLEKNNEIYSMYTLMVNNCPEIVMTIFNYYSQPKDVAISEAIVEGIAQDICHENGLDFVPITVQVLQEDTIANRLLRCSEYVTEQGFAGCSYLVGSRAARRKDMDRGGTMPRLDEKIKAFFDNFNLKLKAGEKYLKDRGLYDELDWMLDDMKWVREKDDPFVCPQNVTNAIGNAKASMSGYEEENIDEIELT